VNPKWKCLKLSRRGGLFALICQLRFQKKLEQIANLEKYGEIVQWKVKFLGNNTSMASLIGRGASVKRHKLSKYWMEGAAFGLADGIICCLGLIIGVAEATINFPALERRSIILASGLLGGLANAFGNSIGFFLSQEAERSVQLHEEKMGMKIRVHTKREVLMSGVMSFLSTLLALLILILPFVFLNIENGIILTFILGVILSFSMGGYIGKISGQNPAKTGLKYAVLALLGALISHEIGDLLSTIIPIHQGLV